MSSQCPICNKKKGNCHFPTQLHLIPPCLQCKHAWKPSGIKHKGSDLKVIHGQTPIRLLGIRYNMWLDSTAQRRYVMDGITELACFLQTKNRDLSIQNSLRLIECTLAPLLAISGTVIIWPEKEFKRLTAAFVGCNKEAWQMSPNTSTVLFTFSKDQGGLQIKMPRAIICSAAWGHLTRCCQFDDGTRQLAEITYKDALEKHGCLDMEDFQFEAKFLTWDQASQNSFTFACQLIKAGYTTLDSIPRIQKGRGTRFYCPALKGVDSKTQQRVTRWIQLLRKHLAHLHAVDIKDAQKQRDPGIEPLKRMTTSKLADKYIVKRNKMQNQCTLLRGQVEDGVVLYLDKVEETIRACDNLLLKWKTHGSLLGDRKVKETMYSMIYETIDGLEQCRDNSSTDDTPTSLTSIETSLDEIKEMDSAILAEEEEAATEFPSILKLLIKKIKIAGNNPQIRQWWYDMMTSRPPPLPKNEEKYREEILDRVEEGWQEEEWAITMPQVIYEILQKKLTTIRNPTATRTSHATEGIQWIRMEELGKALTNRCRAVRELTNKKQKKQGGTRDRYTNSEQLEFECQLKTPTHGRIHELLNLGASSSHILFQSLITIQDLLRLREDMWPSHKTQRKGWWCRAFATAINRQCPTRNRL